MGFGLIDGGGVGGVVRVGGGSRVGGWLEVCGKVERGWWLSLMKKRRRHNTVPFKLPKAKLSNNTRWKPITLKHTTYYMWLFSVEPDTVKHFTLMRKQTWNQLFPSSPYKSPYNYSWRLEHFIFLSDRCFYSLSRKALNSGNYTAFSTDSK